MTPQQLSELSPYFAEGETFLNGQPVDWEPISFETMRLLCAVRVRLGSPIKLIRGAHPNRPEAVDWCCPGMRYAAVVMEALRMPCAVGIYSGMSVHSDTRPLPDGLCPRWIAVREREEILLRRFKALETNRANGWVYYRWSDPEGLPFDLLQLVVDLSEPRTQDASRI